MDWNGNDSNCTDIIKHIGSKEGFVKTKSFFVKKYLQIKTKMILYINIVMNTM